MENRNARGGGHDEAVARDWKRFRGLFSGGRASDEFDTELENHIEEHTREGALAGLGEAEARRVALLRLGGAEQARQAYRDRRDSAVP